jgi:hypothetical protein
MKKFVLSSESRVVGGVTLYRVQSVRDFLSSGDVPVFAGSLGGWVESESCLSQEGGCWVANEALVFAGSVVSVDACVFGDSVVRGSEVTGSARVTGFAELDSCFIGGSATIGGLACLDRCRVTGAAWVSNAVQLSGVALDGEISVTGVGPGSISQL